MLNTLHFLSTRRRISTPSIWPDILETLETHCRIRRSVLDGITTEWSSQPPTLITTFHQAKTVPVNTTLPGGTATAGTRAWPVTFRQLIIRGILYMMLDCKWKANWEDLEWWLEAIDHVQQQDWTANSLVCYLAYIVSHCFCKSPCVCDRGDISWSNKGNSDDDDQSTRKKK